MNPTVKRRIAFWLTATAVIAINSNLFGQDKAEQNWPSFRGPAGNGVSKTAHPPVEWSETKNVKWKVEIPGSGNSSPIVWGDKVFVVTAVATGPAAAAPREDNPPGRRRRRRSSANMTEHEFKLMCLDRSNGKVLWQKTAIKEKPHSGHHRDHGHVSASPVTDGESVFAHFGSRGLYCFDMDGELKWKRQDFGEMRTRGSFGEGSSPTLHENTLFVPWDHEGQSMLYALDKKTGKDKWKVKRDEPTNWISPIVVKANDKWQVVQGGQKNCRGYDYETGEQLWSWTGLTDRPCASPVANDQVVVFASAKGGASMAALEYGKTGRLTSGKGESWTLRRGAPDIPSPLLVENRLYFIAGNSGALSAVNVKDGEEVLSTRRLPSIRSVYSSPVSADGKIFVTGRGGTTIVMSDSDNGQKVIATNSVEDSVDATLALAGDEIFIRGKKKLYCISSKK